MLIVSYDIANNRLRTKFAKYLAKFGYRLQYSVFEIRNSKKVLENIIEEINSFYGKKFGNMDSIIIFHLSAQCKKYCFGYAKNDDDDIIIVE